MIFDNLTLAGIAIAALYGFLPLLFKKEIIRVQEADSGCAESVSGSAPARNLTRPALATDDCA